MFPADKLWYFLLLVIDGVLTPKDYLEFQINVEIVNIAFILS